MAELKQIDEAEHESKKLRNINFQNFPLEQFSDAGKVANEGDPQLKAAADNKLYELEKCTIQIDMNNNIDESTSTDTDDNTNEVLKNIPAKIVSHMQEETNNEQCHFEHDDNTLRKTVYRLTYVPYKEQDQKILLPQSTDMSRKDNLKQLYNSQPEGMCDNEYEA